MYDRENVLIVNKIWNETLVSRKTKGGVRVGGKMIRFYKKKKLRRHHRNLRLIAPFSISGNELEPGCGICLTRRIYWLYRRRISAIYPTEISESQRIMGTKAPRTSTPQVSVIKKPLRRLPSRSVIESTSYAPRWKNVGSMLFTWRMHRSRSKFWRAISAIWKGKSLTYAPASSTSLTPWTESRQNQSFRWSPNWSGPLKSSLNRLQALTNTNLVLFSILLTSN